MEMRKEIRIESKLGKRKETQTEQINALVVVPNHDDKQIQLSIE